MTRTGLAWFAIAVLAGCIPAKFSGYQPTGAGAREAGYCVAGIRDRLRIPTRHGTEILLRAEEDTRDHTILLEAMLVVPAATSVQLDSTDVVLRSKAWTGPRQLSIERITGGIARDHAPQDVLTGSSHASMGTFTIWFMSGETGTLWRTGIPAVREFAVVLPPMKIDGVVFQVDAVTFEAYSDWGSFTCAQ